MRVLVVEDDKKTASFIRKALQAEGFAVDVCHNGDDAWAAARATPFDAIVLDPPASGWSSLVWVLPVAGGVLAAVVLVVVLVRRRRRGGASLDDDVLAGSADPVAVEERRRFLTQSLADADAHPVAYYGDLIGRHGDSPGRHGDPVPGRGRLPRFERGQCRLHQRERQR